MSFSASGWINAIKNDGKTQAFPIITFPGLELTGKTVQDLTTNGEAQAECIIALADRYHSLGGVMVMDLSVEAETFGADIQFSDNEVPTVKNRLINDLSEIEGMEVPVIGSGRTGEYLKAARMASEAIHDKPVFGGIIGPYSLAGRLVDITEMMTLILIDPEAMHKLLRKCTRFLIEYAGAYKAEGVAGVVIAEPAAGLLWPEACVEFSSEYIKQIVEAVQDDSFMVILHNCGNTVPLVPSMVYTGSMACHFGNAVDMAEILPQIPSDILAMGNIDPVGVFRNGTPQKVESITRELLGKAAGYPNFVISSGCDVPPGSPLENIDAFYRAIENQ